MTFTLGAMAASAFGMYISPANSVAMLLNSGAFILNTCVLIAKLAGVI